MNTYNAGMSTPMNVLEETPKVWLVYIYDSLFSVHKTEASAQECINTTVQDSTVKKYCSIDWEVLHD